MEHLQSLLGMSRPSTRTLGSYSNPTVNVITSLSTDLILQATKPQGAKYRETIKQLLEVAILEEPMKVNKLLLTVLGLCPKEAEKVIFDTYVANQGLTWILHLVHKFIKPRDIIEWFNDNGFQQLKRGPKQNFQPFWDELCGPQLHHFATISKISPSEEKEVGRFLRFWMCHNYCLETMSRQELSLLSSQILPRLDAIEREQIVTDVTNHLAADSQARPAASQMLERFMWRWFKKEEITIKVRKEIEVKEQKMWEEEELRRRQDEFVNKWAARATEETPADIPASASVSFLPQIINTPKSPKGAEKKSHVIPKPKNRQSQSHVRVMPKSLITKILRPNVDMKPSRPPKLFNNIPEALPEGWTMEFLFILDRSKSMGGVKMFRARKVLNTLIANLPPGSLFNIIGKLLPNHICKLLRQDLEAIMKYYLWMEAN
jgi:hypothetical protein